MKSTYNNNAYTIGQTIVTPPLTNLIGFSANV